MHLKTPKYLITTDMTCNRQFLRENVASSYNYILFWSFMLVVVLAALHRCLYSSMARKSELL